ncbi:MAG: hypothetical protein JW929_00420 [Anaerolineales bacterium]|nr:hypothetical protein [Anaerolineales bacterium]
MTDWIKVNTELLRSYAGGYENHSKTIGGSGEKTKNSLIMVASAMPEFDGKLQKAARNDAEEIYKQCNNLSSGFKDDSDLLIRILKAFEDVDGQTVNIFEDCSTTCSEACKADSADLSSPTKYYWRRVGEPYLYYGPWTDGPSKGGANLHIDYDFNQIFSAGPISIEADLGLPKGELDWGKFEARQVAWAQKEEYVEDMCGFITVLDTRETAEGTPWVETRYVAP